jgi:hypothetical protein
MIDVSGYAIIKNAKCIEDIICLSNLLACELIKDLELESSKEFFENLLIVQYVGNVWLVSLVYNRKNYG